LTGKLPLALSLLSHPGETLRTNLTFASVKTAALQTDNGRAIPRIEAAV
jgi:hypothetical protein